MRRFSEQTLAKTKRAFEGKHGPALIDFMRCLSLGQSPEEHSSDLRSLATNLGWLDAAAQRTRLGTLVSDSCREYLFWVERNRKLPWVTSMPDLGVGYFAGKDVVELGSGMGANLMLLSNASSIIGIEPTEAYIQLGELFADKEGKNPNKVLTGTAELLPLEANCADVVLCVTSHQYFDLVPSIQEIARILRPDGEVFFFGPTLLDFLKQEIHNVKGARRLLDIGMKLLNSLSYASIEKRVIPARDGWPTGRPVYLSATTIWRFMQRSGIEPVRQNIAVGQDSCIRGRKKAS